MIPSPPSPWVAGFFHAAFVIFAGYFVVVTAYYFFLAVVGFFETGRRARESEEETYRLLAESGFTLPVSIIVPAHNEQEWIADTVASVLISRYPEFEVIVVDDGSTDATLARLDGLLKLEGYDKTYVKEYPDGAVREIFRSKRFSNVTVISKSRGMKKAGAVNAGLNIARYTYVCVIDADTIIEPDALMKVMAPVHRDPERIIGIGSYFGILNGFIVKDGAIVDRRFSCRPIIAYQNLEYIRSFIGSRIAWSRYNAMPIVAGGFAVWRRSIIHELGGFDPAFTCEDVEYTFRAQDYIARHPGKEYRIQTLPYIAGWTEGPSNLRSFLVQRNRWQRVIDETVWRYRHMAFNPRYGSFGVLTFPYLILYEVLGIFMEVSSIAIMLIGVAMGLFDFRAFAAFFCLMLLSQALISIMSLAAFLRSQRTIGTGYVLYLIALSFVETLWYRWIISAAKIAGTAGFLRRNKEPTMYVRQRRAA